MRSIPIIVLLFCLVAIHTPAAWAVDTAPAVEKYAPPFALQDLSGKVINLSDYRGRVVILNFWSTLCAPCTAELPSLSRLAAIFRKDELVVLAVSIDSSDKPVKDFIEANKLVLTVLRDSDKAVFFDQYAGPALPASYLIDRNGIIAEMFTGPREWDSPGTREMIKKLLEKR